MDCCFYLSAITDTAVFAGSYNDYVIKRVGTDLHVTYKTGEIDILRNIEFLSFGNDIVIAESTIGDGPGDPAAPRFFSTTIFITSTMMAI